jgi:hypothetical protein
VPVPNQMEYKFETPSEIVLAVSELVSLGLDTPKLNDLNDNYEIGNLIENLKQTYYQEYKSTSVFSD